MNIFALDTEVTTSNKGDPFDITNKFVLGGIGDNRSYSTFSEVDITRHQVLLDKARMVVLFNAKFDLHWLRRIGFNFSVRLPIWDCQLAEFILSNQQWKYPSLEEASVLRGLGHKIDVVKEQYWANGIDTDEIPFDVLNEYLQQDVSLTYQLYEKQKELFKTPEHSGKYRLFRLQCYDLLALQQMEYNGFKYDSEGSRKEATRLEEECTKLDKYILDEYPDVSINLGSPDHISCMLYGGTIKDETRIPIGEFKSGKKIGQTRYKVLEVEYELPRLVEPLKGSELAKEGYFGTSEPVLLSLRATGKVKKVINALLERRGLEKLRNTYFNGIPDRIDEHHWSDNCVHGQLNQCVTGTGRLSATNPNQQNMTKEVKKYCVSKYDS